MPQLKEIISQQELKSCQIYGVNPEQEIKDIPFNDLHKLVLVLDFKHVAIMQGTLAGSSASEISRRCKEFNLPIF